MEKEKVIEKIDEIVHAIYTPDQIDIDGKFIQLLEAIEVCANTGLLADKLPDINQVLLKVQSAYVIRDYVTLADILLYEIKEKLGEALVK